MTSDNKVSSTSIKSSPCEMTTNKILILVGLILATSVLFYAVNTVFAAAMTPDLFLERMNEEIGNYTKNGTQIKINSYIDQIRAAIEPSLK